MAIAVVVFNQSQPAKSVIWFTLRKLAPTTFVAMPFFVDVEYAVHRLQAWVVGAYHDGFVSDAARLLFVPAANAAHKG